jgi:hypothetical protein
MKRKNGRIAVLAAAVGGVGMMFASPHVASASILSGVNPYGTGAVDTIYADNFTAPATNVNSATTDPNAIVGNVPATETGLDGGSATSAYLGFAVPATTTPDADWQYTATPSANITGQSSNLTTSGSTIGEDTKTITNLTLPLVPIVGEVYDLELTMQESAPAGNTSGHGLEMAYLYGNGNGHITSAQAITNNDSAGAFLDRDGLNSGNSVQYFPGAGTANATSLTPTQAGAPVGGPMTVDIILAPTSATTASMAWYINGVLLSTNTAVGLPSAVTDISFGDNQAASGTFTNFSLTASPVPEPASTGILFVASALALKRRRRRSLAVQC